MTCCISDKNIGAKRSCAAVRLGRVCDGERSKTSVEMILGDFFRGG